MKAIVLIAGMGTRLKPMTDITHKCLTEVNGKAILVNMLDHLESVGVEETILVVGYLKDKIKQKVGDNFKNMKLSYVENPIYDKTNTSYSLWVALKELEVKDTLLFLEGDVFFEKALLTGLLNDGFTTSTAVQKYNPTLDGSFVKLEGNKVIDWVHKSKRQPDFVIEDMFKTINIHKFDKKFVKNTLKPILEQHIEKTRGTEPIEYVMQDIVTKSKVNAFEVGEIKWFEIDDAEELKIAEEMFSEIN